MASFLLFLIHCGKISATEHLTLLYACVSRLQLRIPKVFITKSV